MRCFPIKGVEVVEAVFSCENVLFENKSKIIYVKQIFNVLL